jgi:hypothetical protein
VWVLARAEVDRPMNEVKIQVFQLKLGKSIIKGSLDMSRIVLCVPQLGCDEDVFTLETRNVLVSTLDALCDFLLVLVTTIGGKTD